MKFSRFSPPLSPIWGLRVAFNFLFVALIVLLMSSCGGDFKKIQKSTNNDFKYNAAMKFYNAKEYLKALPLFEDLIPVYRGTAKEQEIYYYYAYTNYQVGDYVMAGFYFSNYYHSFPHTTHAEECEFMHAYCEYLVSPQYNLDQTDTKKAIDAFQTFIDDYPNSTRIGESNKYMDMLRSKLEKKYFEIAKLYYIIEYYHAATIALNNYIKAYPNSKYDDEAAFLVIKTEYLYAINSVERQKYRRLQSVITDYLKFVDNYPKSTFLKDAQDLYDNAQKLKTTTN